MHLYPQDAERKLGFDIVRSAISSACRSADGKRLAMDMAAQASASAAREELSRVGEAQGSLRFDDPIPLESFDSVTGVLHAIRAEGTVIAPEDLASLHRTLAMARRVHTYFQNRKAKLPGLCALVSDVVVLTDLEKRIARTVDERGNVLDTASAELGRIRKRRSEAERTLRRSLERELKKAEESGFSAGDSPTIRSGRMVIPIRAEAKRKVQGFVHDASATGQTVFVEPAVCLELNNELRELSLAETMEIRRILVAAATEVRPHISEILISAETLAELDLTLGKAALGNRLEAATPQVPDDAVVEIVDGRNPALILHFLDTATDDAETRNVVPLSLTLGTECGTLVITGPNAGGKTVALKTIGLLVTMVAYGIPIPANERSRIGFLSHLMVDLGDDQSLEHDLSTFTGHIRTLRHMLAHSDERTLVLIDEAGTGTSPDEGAALAQASLEHLRSRGAMAVITTHHQALKAYASQTERVCNGSMSFDADALQPTYDFRENVPGSSFAFEIAKRAGMDDAVLDMARSLVGSEGIGLEKLLIEASRREEELARQLETAVRESEAASKSRAELSTRLAKLDAEARSIRAEAIAEARRIISASNARVERTIREIKEAGAERIQTKEARDELSRLDDKLAEREVELEPEVASSPDKQSTSSSIKVGDQVRVGEGTAVAIVEELRGDEAIVAFASSRMRVDEAALTKVAGPAGQQIVVTRPSQPEDMAGLRARISVDLRGSKVAEALLELERFIDDAVGAGLDSVEIVHGKGTGALRAAVHDYLATRPEITSYRTAQPSRGGDGMTEVVLQS